MLIRFLSGLFAYFLGALFGDLLFHALPGGNLYLRGIAALAGGTIGVGTVSMLIRNPGLITRFHRLAVPILFIVWAISARQVQPVIRVLLVIAPAIIWPGACRLADPALLADAEPDLRALVRSLILIVSTAAASVPAYFALTVYGPAIGVVDYVASVLATAGMLAAVAARLAVGGRENTNRRVAVILYVVFWTGMLVSGYSGGGPVWIVVPWVAGVSGMVVVRLRLNEGW